MTKNPFYNALAALSYVALVSSIMFIAETKTANTPDNSSILAPIALLSLFTLSAAVMSYIFLLQPVIMYLDGQKKKAIQVFLQTIAAFAGITAVALLALFLI